MMHSAMYLFLVLLSAKVWALDVVFGPDVGINGMKVGASYIQGIMMSPKMVGAQTHADIHLETDVHALPGNPQGFPATSWMPGLKIHFALLKAGSDWHYEADYLPMVAQGGTHYGRNITLDGPGHYLLTNYYEPPSKNALFLIKNAGPGVFPWWKPFIRHYQFDFFGTGKNGGY
ncbi:iron transporter [Marinomonas flavescens]|uniref:iron transporter n=1 Tax=Marinomonas flavescens TaxID=2529379 RepID=UPI001054A294|nr:iron transporter [Marinomonas flavescens]